MNDVLDFLHIVRGLTSVYLWAVLIAATTLLVIDLRKQRASRVTHREESREQKAA